jgi:hypothetical protein
VVALLCDGQDGMSVFPDALRHVVRAFRVDEANRCLFLLEVMGSVTLRIW